MEIYNEIWMQINYHNDYYVSNFGRVKNIETGKILSMNRTNGNGYKIIHIRKDGKGKNYYIHRLVGEAFLENPNNYKYIDHIDIDKTNNNANNLRWCSQSQNCQNRNKFKLNSSGYVGVTKTKNNKFRAQITLNGKTYHLGTFDNAYDAARAYNEKAIAFFGLGAKINNV